MKIQFAGLSKEITPEEISQNIFEIDFDGCLLVKFEKQGNSIVAINGMDGWGNNCEDKVFGMEAEIV